MAYPHPRQAHFILVTIGSKGDLFPFLRLGLELRLRGHRVDIAGPGQHEPFARAAGLDFHALPVDEAVLQDPGLWDPRKGFAVVWRAIRPAMARLPATVAAIAQGRPCTILAHPLALPEADLCRNASPALRIAAVYLAPSNLMTVHGPLTIGPLAVPRWMPPALRRWLWRLVGRYVLDPVALPELNAARRAAGMAPVASMLDYLPAVADLSLTLFAPWFGPRQPDWPQPLVEGDFTLYDPQPGVQLAHGLSLFLARGDAPIVFTHGTGNLQAGAFFEAAVAAAARLGRRAVLLTPYSGQVPRGLPPSVIWQDYQPLRALLPRAAALVHHGGVGTTAEALRAGVPQLVVPLAHDQFDNGARVEALGAGLVLPHRRASARAMAAALERLLASGGIAANCSSVKARFHALPLLSPALDALEALSASPVMHCSSI